MSRRGKALPMPMGTPVVFRVFRGEVTAVFPTIPGTLEPGSMTCYAHVGQHSACDKGWYARTRAAKPEEYADLRAELVRQGYDDLRVCLRITSEMDEVRATALHRMG